MNLLLSRCVVCALSAAAFTIHADTLSHQAAHATGMTSFTSADSSVPAAVQKPQRGLTNYAKSRRDSTLHNLLATLAKEDSLNAISQRETASVSETRKNRRTAPGTTFSISGAFATISGKLAWTARHRPRLSIAAGAAVLFIIILTAAARLAGKKAAKRFMTTTRLSLMDGEVRRACVHIEKHYADPALTPAGLCAAIVTGEPFLEALFQRELGMSIADYIVQSRIHHAKQMVKMNPAADAPSVATQAGFSDTESFKALFEKLTGYTFEDFTRK
jgi:methylphosphotriester-DNA--protein-cysteine methyltransferase